MKSLFPPKCGFALVFITLLIAGCSEDQGAELKTAFHRAVDIYDGESYESDIQPELEQIRQAVGKGANPNLVYQDRTPMYLAIMENDMELAALLVERGAEVGAQDLDRFSIRRTCCSRYESCRAMRRVGVSCCHRGLRRPSRVRSYSLSGWKSTSFSVMAPSHHAVLA